MNPPRTLALLLALLPLGGSLACRPVTTPPAGPAAACPGTESRLTTTPRGEKAWAPGAVIYGVIPPLFGGEPFEDVRRKLDDLQALGVDALWISPIYESDDIGIINYAVTDYFRIRPDFGTEAHLRALVGDAHARGMKVLLDFVPNHTSSAHPYFRDAEARGRASPYWSWYERDADGEATHYFDWENLKNLNHGNPAVRQMLLESCLHWMRSFGVDGFRFDALWGPRERHPSFVTELAAGLRRERADVVLIAEAGARDPFYVQHGFDAAYDWTGELGKAAWESAWQALPAMDDLLTDALAKTPRPERVLRFLNNNDTGERFITRHGEGATRVATVLLHTLPGLALVYAGDEVGAEYEPYEDPEALTWDDPRGLRALHRRLAWLRDEVPAIRDGALVPITTPASPAVHAFAREAGADRAVVIANFGAAATVRLDVRDAAAFKWDALAGRPVEVRAVGAGVLEIDLAATSALVLTPAPRGCG